MKVPVNVETIALRYIKNVWNLIAYELNFNMAIKNGCSVNCFETHTHGVAFAHKLPFYRHIWMLHTTLQFVIIITVIAHDEKQLLSFRYIFEYACIYIVYVVRTCVHVCMCVCTRNWIFMFAQMMNEFCGVCLQSLYWFFTKYRLMW